MHVFSWNIDHKPEVGLDHSIFSSFLALFWLRVALGDWLNFTAVPRVISSAAVSNGILPISFLNWSILPLSKNGIQIRARFHQRNFRMHCPSLMWDPSTLAWSCFSTYAIAYNFVGESRVSCNCQKEAHDEPSDLKLWWPLTEYWKMLELQLQATEIIASSLPYVCDSCVNTRRKRLLMEKSKFKWSMRPILSSELILSQWVTWPNRLVDWQFWGISQYKPVQLIKGLDSSPLLNTV